jgi:hypothetical protein
MKWFLRSLIFITVLGIVAGIGWDRVREYSRQQERQRVRAALARRVSLRDIAGHDGSLEAALRGLASQCDVPILCPKKKPEFDLTWLVDVPDAQLPLETALRVILRQRELAAIPYGGKIVITMANSETEKRRARLHVLPVMGPEGQLEAGSQAWQELVAGSDTSSGDYVIRSIRTRRYARARYSLISQTVLDEPAGELTQLIPSSVVITSSRDHHREFAALLGAIEEASSPEGRKLMGTRFAGVALRDLPIFEALEKPVSVRFDKTPLAAALAELSRNQNVPIFLHSRWLFYQGDREEKYVDYSGEQVPLRTVLAEILSEYYMEFFVEDGMIQVSSANLASKRIGVYDAADLLRLAAISPPEFEEMIALVLDKNRGYRGDELGVIEILPPGWIVTRQSEGNHRRIAQLLAQLRVGLQPREVPSLEVPPPWKLASDASPVSDESEWEPMVLDLRELFQSATRGQQRRELRQFLNLIEASKRLTYHKPDLLGHLLILTDSPSHQMAVKNLIATLARRNRESLAAKKPAVPAEAATPLWLNLADADAALARRLADEIDVELPIMTLQSAVEQLAARYNIKLSFDNEHLDIHPSRAGYPVSLKTQGAPLYEAFQDLLHPRQMGFYLEGGQLVVTTDEQAERQCLHRLYPTADILDRPPEMQLLKAMAAIESFSWVLDEGQSYGGEAELLAVPDTDLICASQTLAGHLRMEKLLSLVRQAQSAEGPRSATARINGILFEAHSAAPLFAGKRKFLPAELASFLDEGAGLLSVQGLRRADNQVAIVGDSVVAQGNSVHLGRVRQMMDYLLRWHDTLPRAAEVFEKQDPAAAERTLATLAGTTDPAERAHLAFLLRFCKPPPRTAWNELAAQHKKLSEHEELGLESPLHEQLSLALLSWAINPATSLDDLCAECKQNRSTALQVGILFRLRLLHSQPYNVAGERDESWFFKNWSQDTKDFAQGFQYASNPELPKFHYDPARPVPTEPAEQRAVPPAGNRRRVRPSLQFDY